ncbi:energy transducer TonB [Aureimonas psammosilenae]|uniref:hypothetical protein n=1 Tax=Aureimonas psammosilenae TaxID=2495496 RepID=UPI00126082B6|nr:hypothetical protein [Aureimonas psammosilenae]
MFRRSLLSAVAALGLTAANAANASDQAITEALSRAVQACWLPPGDASGAAVVRLRIAPDGTLSAASVLNEGSAGRSTLAASALRAVRSCAPYPRVGELIGREAVEIQATFSLAGFSAVTDGRSAPDAARSVAIRAGDDITLRVPEPEGLCYVDPAGGGLQSRYLELMSGALAGNYVHGFFLDCGTVRQLEAGETDFTLPQRTMTLSSPLASGGGLQRFPERSPAEAVAFYEHFFRQQGAPGSALDRHQRAVETRLRETWDVAVASGAQVVAAVDERAVYTAMVSTAQTQTGPLRQMSIGAFGQVLDLPITLSLYAPYEDGGIDGLLAQTQALVAALVANSGRED